ncbi:ABC transporter substrate-binding protein [Cuneatibacter caecimuris]|uniref:Carbohydrate ABC transporter substrate-binding protein (CUT1 family) n=1 Tax=Cuneatibacter caecimuris TaxID=1796618 RepID=A0A4Q7PKL4_9FIRM|nr:ABC transporter substrate-binding protein [Cuneatibacter caecimuris]RZT00401.1 carbohydrate ABC transporter substrate-binding protein (CUT1 family) [Cuneatibacter caecimuris]
MKRKGLALTMAMAMGVSMLAGCGSTPADATTAAPATSPKTEAATTKAGNDSTTEAPTEGQTSALTPVKLSVFSTYAGNDANARLFQDAYKAWEKKTGSTVYDSSAISDETVKARVTADFESGAEPDVLMYFTGADADSFLDKLVPVSEIQKAYPEYASNMDMTKVPASSDGNHYGVPVNGYWEGLFVNTKLLKDAGVDVPDENTTWEEFIKDCETLKEKGITPISASLATEIHYWFEFCIFNHRDVQTQNVIPSPDNKDDYLPLVEGITDMKEMYEKGLFPENTLSMDGKEAKQLFIDGKAAFYCDGNWAAQSIFEGAENPEDFTVTYVPGEGNRKSTDIIAGMSSGYMITRKAWEDPEIREAAVDFVMSMTTDDVVAKFAGVSTDALKTPAKIDKSQYNALQLSGKDMASKATGLALALQDGIPTEARVPVFDNMAAIVSGEVTPEEAVVEMLTLVAESKTE